MTKKNRAKKRGSDAKAATGPGAFAMSYHTPLSSFSRDPHRLMAEAQALFHTNAWVGLAERAIGKKLISTPWHLEDEDGETITEDSPEDQRVVLRLMTKPSADISRKGLWGLTGRHTGLAGNGFWYLDQRDAQAGTPLSVVYINPCRMTPALDAAGRVVGWTLDHPDNMVVNAYAGYDSRRTGVPLDVEEVIHFKLDEPDSGIWGIGIAESAQRTIQLNNLTVSHTGGVLGSGGRLSGLIAPKVGAQVSDDQWVQFVRDWRSITSDPDAAKRLQVAKMPLDFTQMTVAPKELQLLDVSKQTKEDILAQWQVPPSQVGITQAAGLNSGETKGYDEAAFSQGAVQPRGEVIAETIQTELLDRFAELGTTVRLVMEWPEYDDEEPLFVNAEKAKIIPLTINQRLEMVGRDPLDEALYGQLGNAIYMDQSMVPLFNPAGGAGGSVPTPPSATPPSTIATMEEVAMVKGRLADSLGRVRDRVAAKWEPRFQRVAAKVLGQQLDLAQSHAAHMIRKPADTSWWNEEREMRRWMEAIENELEQFGREVADKSRSVTRIAKADPVMYDSVLTDLKQDVGNRITAINETTRQGVRTTIGDMIQGGALTDPSPVALSGIIRGAVMQNGQPVFGELRSETIARTETAHLYNQATLHTYQQLGVEEVEAIDGTHDAECAARNGARFLAVEARAISDHPNGTLDWVPVVNERAAVGMDRAFTERTTAGGVPDLLPSVGNAQAERNLQASLAEIRAETAGLDYERGYLIDRQTGKIIVRKEGDRVGGSSVSFGDDIMTSRDNILVHNHPDQPGLGGLGSAPSDGDLALFRAYRMAEMRIETNGATYIVRPPGGVWAETEGEIGWLAPELKAKWMTYENAIFDSGRYRTMNADEMIAEIAEKVTTDFGLEYRVIPRTAQ